MLIGKAAAPLPSQQRRRATAQYLFSGLHQVNSFDTRMVFTVVFARSSTGLYCEIVILPRAVIAFQYRRKAGGGRRVAYEIRWYLFHMRRSAGVRRARPTLIAALTAMFRISGDVGLFTQSHFLVLRFFHI